MEPSVSILEGVSVTPLKKIHNPKGNVYHGLKCTDDSFSEFGEAYFTTIHHGDIKGWKQHTKMVMNLLVPVGNVGFHFYNQSTSKGAFVKVGASNYVRLTVQPRIWMAFNGIGEDLNLVLNISSIPHDPDEAINADIESFPLSETEEP